MSTASDQLATFQQFAVQKVDAGEAETLEELFPSRPEVIDPLKVAKKLPRVEHRFIALRRAVECVINNLLIRNLEQDDKVEFQ